MKGDSNDHEAPQTLTGCDHGEPEGLFECAVGLLVEVRPAIILSFIDCICDFYCTRRFS